MFAKIVLAVMLSSTTALRVQNRPSQTHKDNEYHFDDEMGTYPPMAKGREGFHQVHEDLPNLDCLKDKRILFMGDSTVQEILWRSLLLLNKTADSTWMEIPITQCHNVDCLKLSGKKGDKIAKAHARCGSNSLEACQKQLSVVQESRFGFDWVWSGGKNPTNNFGGLSHAIYDDEWLKMFRNATQSHDTRNSNYDAVVFTSGNHDKFFDETTKAAYDKGLDDTLDMLEPLARKGVFLQASAAGDHKKLGTERTTLSVNKEKMQERSSKWTLIDRLEFHQEDHCAHIKYKNKKNPDYYYSFPPQCDKVVEAMRAAIC